VIGKLVGDVRVNESANGKIAHFGLPINFTRPRKNQETGKWEGDSFIIDVDVFDKENYKLGTMVAQSLKKGSQVYVEGRLRNRTYTNNSGVEVTRMTLVADVVEFLDGRPEGAMGGMGNESVSRAPMRPAAAPAARSAAPAAYPRGNDSYEDEPETNSPGRRGGGSVGSEDEIPF
jgi:single stranded DNA-binding protein